MIDTKTRLRQEFESEIEQWVVDAVARGATNFPAILGRPPGVYPPTVIDTLLRLHKTKRVPAKLVSAVQRQARDTQSLTPRSLDPLPPPHPLDFEWRFTSETARGLLALAQSMSEPDDKILLLGTPTVAVAAATQPIDRTVSFVGGDNPVTKAVVALNDLHAQPIGIRPCHPLLRLPTGAGIVVVDPPWYPDFIRPMLSAAASACRVGGFVLLSMMPIGTRPGAALDRDRIIRYLQRLSLEIVETREGFLVYETPYFEANAMAVAGVTAAPINWRRSDLIVLRKTNESTQSVIGRATPKQWHELAIGRMRLFVRRNRKDVASAGPLIRQVLPGDVLPSVSRRDPRRRKAQVWTSGNRIFSTPRPSLVLAAALQASNVKSAYSASHGKLSKVDRDEVKRLRYALCNLADHEEAEEYSGRVEEAFCLIDDTISVLTNSSLTSRKTVFG